MDVRNSGQQDEPGPIVPAATQRALTGRAERSRDADLVPSKSRPPVERAACEPVDHDGFPFEFLCIA